MPHCRACGAEVGEDDAFCRECGADLEAVTMEEEEPSADERSEDPAEPVTEVDDESSATAGTSGQSEPQDHSDNSYDIDWRHAGSAIALAIVPAFGASVAVGVSIRQPVGEVFWIGIAIFAYLLYQRPTAKAMVGGMSFWLAIECFLTPLALLGSTITFASQEVQTAAGQAGAAIGGFFLTIIAFVVGVPLGIVFYLVSRRLEADDETDGGTEDAQPTA